MRFRRRKQVTGSVDAALERHVEQFKKEYAFRIYRLNSGLFFSTRFPLDDGVQELLNVMTHSSQVRFIESNPRIRALGAHIEVFGEEQEMTQYPMLIERAEDYTPEIGDRLEVTWHDQTIIIGIVMYVDNGRAFTENSYCVYNSNWFMYPDSCPDSVRLLSRKPKPLAVGDLITGEQAATLPPGSVFTRDNSIIIYDIVVLSDSGPDQTPRNKFSRVDKNYTWPRLDTGQFLRIKYINN